MAAALGVTASVIAVVTIALQGSKILFDAIGTYKDAGELLRDLTDDVGATTATLTQIIAELEGKDERRFSESVKTCLQQFEAAIEGCGKACSDFAHELKGIMSHSTADKVSKRDKAKMWWKEKKILGFRYRLGSYKSTLSIVLQLASIQAIEKNQAQTSELQLSLDKAVSHISGQIQGVAIGEPSILESLKDDEQDSDAAREVLPVEKAGLGDCLNACSFTLAKTAVQTGTQVMYAEALDDATQLLGSFGNVSGFDYSGAALRIEKMIAKDRAFQAAGHFTDNTFIAALSRSTK